MKNRVCKKCGMYYQSIAARKRHRQNGCGLEALDNKVIDKEEDISHEENSQILVANGDNNHVPIINIYGLLMNCEFIQTQTDRDH